MPKLRLKDLEEQGFEVTKHDAQQLHHKMNEISQRGDEGHNEVYAGDDTPAAIDPDKSGDKNLLGLVDELKQTISEKDEYISEKDEYISDLEARIDQLQSHGYVKPDTKSADDEKQDGCGDLNDTSDEDIDPEENTQGPDNSGDQDNETPAFTFSLPTKPEHHLTKKKRLQETGLQERTVNQEDIDSHPELAAAGVNVGDTIEVPVTA